MTTAEKVAKPKRVIKKRPGWHDVELRILAEVYDQAKVIGERYGISLASLARYAIFTEHARLWEVADPDAPVVPEGQRPPLREYGKTRKPLRFSIPKDTYEAAAAAIRTSGRSVSGVVEDFLKVYIERFTRDEK